MPETSNEVVWEVEGLFGPYVMDFEESLIALLGECTFV